MVIGLILFALVGLAFGYALPGRLAYTALAIPLAFAILTALNEDLDFGLIVKAVIALILTTAGVIAGQMLDRRLSEGDAQRA